MFNPICIHHSPCADGFTSAWIVRKALGDIEFHPGVYGQPPPNVAGRDVILVDFSYKRSVIEGLLQSGDIQQANTILILDHHRTAEADLAGIDSPESGYTPNLWRSDWEQSFVWPVRALFDMSRSGAQVTWDFFFPSQPRPLLVDYTGDRDLWKFALPSSREVNAYVFANEYSFEAWDELDRRLRYDMQMVAEMGGAIEKKHHKDVAELVGIMKRRMVIGGISVPVANIPFTMTSDAGHMMAQGEPFAACYWETATGRVFSLRSTDEGMDVSEVARKMGGGGHRNAAGFQAAFGWSGDE